MNNALPILTWDNIQSDLSSKNGSESEAVPVVRLLQDRARGAVAA